jgi:glutamyl-tRNA synthetase
VGGPFAPYRQSERTGLYDAALERLLGAGQAFLCCCSRADVARAASAPHEEDEGPRYPGTCRGRDPGEVRARAAASGRGVVVRFAAPHPDPLPAGRGEGESGVDDFVLRRADGVASYQLAVVVDDAAMEVTRVVRGDDLLSSTPRQLALYRALGLEAPAFAHVPLVLAAGGQRLAKRTRPASIGSLRTFGVPPGAIVGVLAASAGLCAADDRPMPRDLVAGFDLARVDRRSAVIDHAVFVT